jgi:hypothetical protein
MPVLGSDDANMGDIMFVRFMFNAEKVCVNGWPWMGEKVGAKLDIGCAIVMGCA